MSTEKSVRGHASRGIAWSGVSKAAEQAITWVVTIFMARLLVPADYGVMALAVIVIQFTSYVTELSIGGALVQKESVDDDHLSTTFWFGMLTGVFAYGVAFVCAGNIASFFQTPSLEPVIKVLGVTFITGMAATVPLSMLSRQLLFKRRSLVDSAANLASGAISIASAYAGFGVWSLVYGSLTRGGLSAVLFFVAAKWRPRFVFDRRKLAELLRVGVPLTFTKFFGYLYYNVDNIIVGRFLGEGPLGLYAMAFRLSTMSVEKIAAVVNQVSFSVFARLQGERTETLRYFTSSTVGIARIVFPLLAGLAVTADVAVPVILGEKWVTMVPLLQCLTVVAMFRALAVSIEPMLLGRGKANLCLLASAVTAGVVAAAVAVGVRFGVQGVAWAWLLAYPPLFLYLLKLGLTELELPLKTYLRSLWPTTASALIMVLAVHLMRSIVPATNAGAFGLFWMVALGGAVYVIALLLLDEEVWRRVARLLVKQPKILESPQG